MPIVISKRQDCFFQKYLQGWCCRQKIAYTCLMLGLSFPSVLQSFEYTKWLRNYEELETLAVTVSKINFTASPFSVSHCSSNINIRSLLSSQLHLLECAVSPVKQAGLLQPHPEVKDSISLMNFLSWCCYHLSLTYFIFCLQWWLPSCIFLSVKFIVFCIFWPTFSLSPPHLAATACTFTLWYHNFIEVSCLCIF